MEAHVIPESFVCSGKDLTENIPAGIFFTQKDSMSYNFRLTLDIYFMRISGIYINDENICEKVETAMQDPAKQVNTTDPKMVSDRVDSLAVDVERAELETLRLKYSLVSQMNRGFFGGPKPPDKKMIAKLLQIKKKDPGISRDNLKSQLKSEGFSVSDKEFDLIMEVYFPDSN